MRITNRTQRKTVALVAALVVVLLTGGGVAGVAGSSGASGGTGNAAAQEDAAPGTVVSDGLRHAVPAVLQEAVVTKVTDGDTLHVSVEGRDEKVRLIGINTPESVAPQEGRNTEEGVEASDYMKSILHVGDTVYLQPDTESEDKYGRLLRYVWTARPDSLTDRAAVEASMLNARLVADGYAVAHRYAPNDAYADVFADIQDEARASGVGLWTEGDAWAEGL